MRRNLYLTGLVVASLSVARSLAAADAGPTDPCRLVTKPEVQTVLGSPITSSALNSPPPRHNESAVRICSFQAQNGKILNVYVGSRTKAGFDREKAGMATVPGIGDDAYARPPSIVASRKGETVVMVTAMNFTQTPDDPQLLERVKTLTRTAMGRL
jgi:hypothetical protein